MFENITLNGSNILSELKSYFKEISENFYISKDSIDALIMQSRISSESLQMLSRQFRAINSIVKNKKISNPVIMKSLTSSEYKEVNSVFTNISKMLVKYPKTAQAFRDKGIFIALANICKFYNTIVDEVIDTIESEKPTFVERIIHIRKAKLFDVVLIGCASVSIVTDLIFRNMFYISTVILSNDPDTDKDELIRHAKLILSVSNETLDKFIMIANNDGKIIKKVNDDIRNRGINFNVFKSDFDGQSPLDMLVKNDFSKQTIQLASLIPSSQQMFIGNLLLKRTLKKIASLKERKEWMELRVLHLKMKLNNKNIDQEEYDRMNHAIEYYEDQITKLDSKIIELYE
jgi:hypothetical protein